MLSVSARVTSVLVMSPSPSHGPLPCPGHPYSTHTILINSFSFYLLGRSDQKRRFSFDLKCVALSVSSSHAQNLSCLTSADRSCDGNSGNLIDVCRTTGVCCLFGSVGNLCLDFSCSAGLLCSIFQGKLKCLVETMFLPNFEKPESSNSKCL